MKNIKKEYLILGMAIVILSAYLLLHNEGGTPVDLPVLPDISKTDIAKVEIAKAGKTLTLIKKESGWVIGENSLPADSVQVRAMVDNIKNLKLTALVSESDDYSRYDLDDEHKIKVTAFSKDQIARTFDLGKTASSYRHTFIRLDNDKRVFHAEQNFREAFDKPENDLTDKKVLACDAETITRIEGHLDSASFGYTKKKETAQANPDAKTADTPQKPGEKSPDASSQTRDIWADMAGKEIDKTKISQFLGLFSNLTCSAYVTGSKKEDFTGPQILITLTGAKPLSLSIFPKKEGQDGYPAVSSENPFPFLLPEEKVDEIKNKLSGL